MDLELKYVVGPDGKRVLTIPVDRRALAVAYIRDGAVGAPAEIEAVVQEGHDALFAALEGLSEAQVAHKPSSADWCVLELMAHVVSVKRIVAGLCLSLAQGHWPPGIGPEWEEPSAQDGVTLAGFGTLTEAREAAQAAHDGLLAFIRGIDEGVNTEVRFRHFVFGALNSREWALFQRIHDDDHTPQIASITASPNFPST